MVTSMTGTVTRNQEKWRDGILSEEVRVLSNKGVSECQEIYRSLGNNMKIFDTLHIGIKKKDKIPLLDLDNFL